jgi:hypothetical protein
VTEQQPYDCLPFGLEITAFNRAACTPIPVARIYCIALCAMKTGVNPGILGTLMRLCDFVCPLPSSSLSQPQGTKGLRIKLIIVLDELSKSHHASPQPPTAMFGCNSIRG